jgi:hypothetical protein
MQIKHVAFSALKLVGVQTRTDYSRELNQQTSNIGPLVNQFWSQGIATKIKHRNMKTWQKVWELTKMTH